jgi:hypothetical protein
MGLTNVFLNSYEQPENKLTYNFLCLLEHMPQRNQFCEFLTGGRMKLTADPIKSVETVFSGGASNPDGAVTFSDVDGKGWKVYLENKTSRRLLDRGRILTAPPDFCN